MEHFAQISAIETCGCSDTSSDLMRLNAENLTYYYIFQGRHAVATDDIKTGEIIGIEEPVVHFLYPERLLSNCTNCFAPVIIPVPCFGCSGIVFCSKNCRYQCSFYSWGFEHTKVELFSIKSSEILSHVKNWTCDLIRRMKISLFCHKCEIPFICFTETFLGRPFTDTNAILVKSWEAFTIIF
jgi:hypothetical protein